MDFTKIIKIDPNARIPKYRQVVDSIKDGIVLGKLKLNQKIPSINSLSEEFLLSRDTVEKAYGILKESKIIQPVRGKGFYISRADLNVDTKVIFLINKLSVYKMIIYNAFVEKMQGVARVDLHIYHCDEDLFYNLVSKNLGLYDYYVVMPHFKTANLKYISFTDKVLESLRKVPKERLVILDNKITPIKGFIEIYQDFENDLYNSLKWFLPKIRKYKRLILTYRQKSDYPYPKRILHGFRKFCVEVNMDFEILDEIYEDTILKQGDLFMVLGEADLVNLLKQVRKEKIQLGKDLGIISFNETPLKELLNIAVVSTDFKAMGQMTAEMILTKTEGSLKNHYKHIDRASL